MERLLASLLTPALAAGWQSTEDNRKAFRELCFLLAARAGALAALFTGTCSIPCRMCQGRLWTPAAEFAPVWGGMLRGAVPQLPVQIAGLAGWYITSRVFALGLCYGNIDLLLGLTSQSFQWVGLTVINETGWNLC